MSTTMVASEVKAGRPVASSIQDIPLERIRESSRNPRRVFDEAQLQELATNIRSHGVLQAILVRPSLDGAVGTYELVAGARRFRASNIAGKDTIPATVRDLTDAECQEIRLIENLQRVNIHELDEGIGYRSLRDLRPDFYTMETIAAQVAKSPAYVKGRISLTELVPAAQTAFYDGKLTVAHGLEIARLQPLCGGRDYVAFGSGTGARRESNCNRMPHNSTHYRARRNAISPLSRCHGFASLPCFTSQRAKAR